MNNDFDRMMQVARKHDKEMEGLEKDAGSWPPKRCPMFTHLRTVEAALECAVKIGDWKIVCEGIVLLQQAIERIPPAEREFLQ